MLNGAFLDGSVVKIGPVAGFRFAQVNDDKAYRDSILIRGYGSSFQETIYVIFKPPARRLAASKRGLACSSMHDLLSPAAALGVGNSEVAGR